MFSRCDFEITEQCPQITSIDKSALEIIEQDVREKFYVDECFFRYRREKRYWSTKFLDFWSLAFSLGEITNSFNDEHENYKNTIELENYFSDVCERSNEDAFGKLDLRLFRSLFSVIPNDWSPYKRMTTARTARRTARRI